MVAILASIRVFNLKAPKISSTKVQIHCDIFMKKCVYVVIFGTLIVFYGFLLQTSVFSMFIVIEPNLFELIYQRKVERILGRGR